MEILGRKIQTNCFLKKVFCVFFAVLVDNHTRRECPQELPGYLLPDINNRLDSGSDKCVKPFGNERPIRRGRVGIAR